MSSKEDSRIAIVIQNRAIQKKWMYEAFQEIKERAQEDISDSMVKDYALFMLSERSPLQVEDDEIRSWCEKIMLITKK